ncbi:amylo-alpha-1,6-glucosidase [Anthocerotibacter panamensis]|uniref:amylo-alpha-1,6-glucosidase n=1 Tax=Anthocerotibacter panamensis TaxID=2857077 RepID=UPI001C408553|nr:amylo-alpha-1,6-glucosidase [Anthocerotibacter panamensis]
MNIHFGREVCGVLPTAEAREWLVTNGLGGYACGSVAGLLTRRYHGLLVAALQPPLARTLLLAQLEETAQYGGVDFPLATHRWADGTIAPQGYLHIEHFRLEGSVPVWQFACADALLEKQVWMPQGQNTTCIRYTLRRGTKPLTVTAKALVNYRDFHGQTHAQGWQMEVHALERGVCVQAFPAAVPFYLAADRGTVEVAHAWYYGFQLALEQHRGLDHQEDHLHCATFIHTLHPGESFTVTASLEPDAQGSLEAQHRHEQQLLTTAGNMTEPWLQQLVLAADQCIVVRPLADGTMGKTILAGYPWFSDWGRDTMISLPGLTLVTGRPELARTILQTFAHHVDQGMLPNRFPDQGARPVYNTVDATLWYFEAIRAYYQATGDDALLEELFPVLIDIMDLHHRGTRHNIHVDPTDGLLYAGEAGVQLTWMDAKVGDWVVTPRIGKPIEINALWYNALRSMVRFAQQLGKSGTAYEEQAKQVLEHFSRFWAEDLGYCYDVLDGPDGADPSLRPNQLFAVSLPERLLPPAQERAVVEVCARHLLTSHGLRSLAPTDPCYQGHYGGSALQRDGAYHQGTVWGWLLGPFTLAHLRVYQDPARARSFLLPMAHHLMAHGLGSISEIFDGDAPMTPRGCFAQAWSVAEVLRAWQATQ